MKSPIELKHILKSKSGWQWVIIDFCIAYSALWLGFNLSPHGDFYSSFNESLLAIIYASLFVISIRLCGLNTHRIEHLFTRYEITFASIQGSVIAYLILYIAVNLVYFHHLGRYVTVMTIGLSILGVVFCRIGYQWYLKNHPIKVAFFGCNEQTAELVERFKTDPHFQVVCIGIEDSTDADAISSDFKTVVIEDPNAFIQFLQTTGTEFAISVYDKEMSPLISQTIERLPFAGIDVLNLGAFIELFHREIPLSYRNLHWHTADFFLPGQNAAAIIKRMIDFSVAVGVLLLVLPFFPIIALLIKLDSKGPAFYSQTRMGFLGKPFKLYKFRTMRSDAEAAGAQWAQKNDPRVTRLGAFLRKTRLDELPQLLNVLKGDMSFVGPRPERPEFVEDLKKSIPLYEWRCLVLPGLTGWAQIRYQYTDTIEGTKRKLQFDLFYIKHHSIWLDLQIILSTVPLLMKGSR